MKNMKYIINALPLVADALGRKYGVKVLISGEKAYTDGKDIHLPALPLDSDDTILNMARGYIDHESAHLRLTDFDMLHASKLSEVEKYIWNIIEDYRVEKQLADLYPGCGDNFKWLIRHLFIGKTEVESGEEIENAGMIFSWLLLSLRALAVPELVHEKDKLEVRIVQNYPGLVANLQPLVSSIAESCRDTGKAIEIARKITRVLEKYSLDNQKYKDMAEDEESKINDVQAVPACSSSENHKSNTTKGKTMAEIKGNNTVQNENAANQESVNPAIPSSLTDDNSDLPPNSPLDQLQDILANPSPLEKLDIGKLVGQILDGVKADNIESGISVAIPSPFNGNRLTPAEISDIRKATTALRTRLAALLQSKVTVRNTFGRNGRLCCQRIARIAAGEGRIFVKRGDREGINTAIHILLDASGSMGHSNKITLACNACFAVAEALQKIQRVGLAITAFPNGTAKLDNSGQLQWGTVAQVLSYRQKMHNKFHIQPNGSTPMAEALWWVLQQMSILPEKRKILLLLTDGEPDNLYSTRNALDCHIAAGHEIYGIGICTEAIRRLIADEDCRSIYNLLELAPAIFEILRTSLLNPERSKKC